MAKPKILDWREQILLTVARSDHDRCDRSIETTHDANDLMSSSHLVQETAIRPQLAEELDISEDGLTYVSSPCARASPSKLVPALCDAETVKFSFTPAMGEDLGANPASAIFEAIEKRDLNLYISADRGDLCCPRARRLLLCSTLRFRQGLHHASYAIETNASEGRMGSGFSFRFASLEPVIGLSLISTKITRDADRCLQWSA